MELLEYIADSRGGVDSELRGPIVTSPAVLFENLVKLESHQVQFARRHFLRLRRRWWAYNLFVREQFPCSLSSSESLYGPARSGCVT